MRKQSGGKSNLCPCTPREVLTSLQGSWGLRHLFRPSPMEKGERELNGPASPKANHASARSRKTLVSTICLFEGARAI